MSVILEKGQTIGFYKAIIPIIVSVFGVYLTIGIALGLLPKFVEEKLGYDSFYCWVGYWFAIARDTSYTRLLG